MHISAPAPPPRERKAQPRPILQTFPDFPFSTSTLKEDLDSSGFSMLLYLPSQPLRGFEDNLVIRHNGIQSLLAANWGGEGEQALPSLTALQSPMRKKLLMLPFPREVH